jgi:hypothetical protein
MTLESLNNIKVSQKYALSLRIKRFLAWQAARLVRLGQAELALRDQMRELKTAQAERTLEPKADFYSEEVEVNVWWKYKRALSQKDGPESNIQFHSNLLVDEVSRLLRRGGITSVVNFGVAFGGADYKLAEMHPKISFDGVDRSKVAQRLNQESFAISNLNFYAQDILNFLDNELKSPETTLFVHQRTFAFLYPELARQVYQKCHHLGVKQILCIEPIGYCHSINRFYEFSVEDRPSEVLRYPLIVHNYPFLLKSCGYIPETLDALEYPHVYDDMRALRIVANNTL